MQEARALDIPDIKKAIATLKENLWRKSHSLNSEITFQRSIRKFEKFLNKNEIAIQHCIENPLQVIDNFVQYLDSSGSSARTVYVYTYFVKRLLKKLGAKINEEDFKDSVTMPKKRAFQDDKPTKEDMRRIILSMKHEVLKLILMLEKDSQIRPGESLGLKVLYFNFAHDPSFLEVPAELAKSDVPRELFFSNETKRMFLDYIKKHDKKPNDFLFLDNVQDSMDEREVQHKIALARNALCIAFRRHLESPEFADLNTKVQGKTNRYKIHPYSFKKFAFTIMADHLGETAARAIKGDAEYVMTYYKKSREERAEDYREVMPYLSIFDLDEKSKIRKEVEETIKKMGDKDLAKLQELMNTAIG